jgi:hypothetical protein
MIFPDVPKWEQGERQEIGEDLKFVGHLAGFSGCHLPTACDGCLQSFGEAPALWRKDFSSIDGAKRLLPVIVGPRIVSGRRFVGEGDEFAHPETAFG